MLALVLQVRHDITQEARNRSLAVAQSFANAPGTPEALSGPDPTAVLQPRAEAAREGSRVDFIVVMNTEGIRYTHPRPDRIGKKFVGNIAPALAGGTEVEEIDGTIGRLVQAVVPVKDRTATSWAWCPPGSPPNTWAASPTGSCRWCWPRPPRDSHSPRRDGVVSRRLMRQTHGLGPREMTRM